MLTLSFQKMNFQNIPGLSGGSLTKSKRFDMFFDDTKGFLSSNASTMTCKLNFHIIVDICTFIQDDNRDIYNSLEMMRELDIT